MIPLLLPLLAAMIYGIGALSLNAAGKAGWSGRRITLVCNLCTALLFLVFYDWAKFPALPSPFWPVLMLAGFFIGGQLFTILSLSLGEVSTVTPILGIKVIFVNIIITLFLREPLGANVWIAGLLSVVGVTLLRANPGKHPRPAHGVLAVICALLAALGFAAFDVTIQHWSPILGYGLFLPPAMVVAALLSCLLMIGDRGTWKRSATDWRKLGTGAFLLAFQSLILISAIGTFGHAADANVVYSSRGVWSVVFVWLLGHFFHNTELSSGPKGALGLRLGGAILISSAIILVVL